MRLFRSIECTLKYLRLTTRTVNLIFSLSKIEAVSVFNFNIIEIVEFRCVMKLAKKSMRNKYSNHISADFVEGSFIYLVFFSFFCGSKKKMQPTSSNEHFVKYKECGKIFIRENSDHIQFHCTFCDETFQKIHNFHKHVKLNHRFNYRENAAPKRVCDRPHTQCDRYSAENSQSNSRNVPSTRNQQQAKPCVKNSVVNYQSNSTFNKSRRHETHRQSNSEEDNSFQNNHEHLATTRIQNRSDAQYSRHSSSKNVPPTHNQQQAMQYVGNSAVNFRSSSMFIGKIHRKSNPGNDNNSVQSDHSHSVQPTKRSRFSSGNVYPKNHRKSIKISFLLKIMLKFNTLLVNPANVAALKAANAKRNIGDAVKGIKSFCIYCGMTSNNLNKLQQHTMVCQQQKNNCCSFCDKRYEKKNSLLRHQYYHHPKEFPYKCLYCPAAFKQIEELDLHKRIHSKSNQQKCDYENCAKVSVTQFEKDNHIRDMHSEHRYACNHCDHTTNDRKQMVSHVKNEHPTEPSFYSTHT